MGDVVRTKIGQAKHMGKWEPHVAMIRLVRDLQAELEEGNMLRPDELTDIDNIIYAFFESIADKDFGRSEGRMIFLKKYSCFFLRSVDSYKNMV